MRVLVALWLLGLAAPGLAQEESGAGLTPVPPPPGEEPVEPVDSAFVDDEFDDAPATQPQPQPQTQPTGERNPDSVPAPPPGYGGTQPQQGYDTQPQRGYTGVGNQPGYVPGGTAVRLRQPPPLDPTIAAQIAALEQERTDRPIGGRITMLAAGGAGTAVMVLLALEFADLEREDTGCDRCGDNPGTIVFSAISVATFTLAVTGLVLFIRRLRERSAINRQIRELRSGRQLALLEW